MKLLETLFSELQHRDVEARKSNRHTGKPREGRLVAEELSEDHSSEIRESKSPRYLRICCMNHMNVTYLITEINIIGR